jgi:hypothetical protein
MTNSTTTPKFTVLGTTDSVCKCECCGRTDLKKTVALGHVDVDGNWTGDVSYFGTTCAARAIAPTRKFTRTTAEQLLNARRAEGDALRRQRVSRAMDAFFSALTTEVPAYHGETDRRVVNGIGYMIEFWAETGRFSNVVRLWGEFRTLADSRGF